MINELISILVKRWQQVFITFALITCGVAVLTFMMPKLYESRMKILVKGERANVNGYGSSGPVSDTQVNTEIELLTSRNLIEKVVRSNDLQRFETATSPTPAEREAIKVEKAVRRLQKELKIAPVRKANIIEVSFLARSPKLAASVLRDFSEKYLEAHLKADSSPGTYPFFSAQAEYYNQELKATETRLAEFQERGDIVLLEQQKESSLQKTLESKSALLQTEAAIGEYKSKMTDTNRQLGAVTGRVVTQSRVTSNQYLAEHLNTMMAELQNKRTQLLTKFKPEDRTVKEVDQEIANTQAALEGASKQTGVDQTTDVNPVRQSLEVDLSKSQSDLAGLQTRQRVLASQEQVYRAQLMKLDSETAAHDDLIRHKKEAEENYLLYSRKAEEARISESLDRQRISNVSIIETPNEAHLPAKPNVLMNLLLGTFLAGCIGIGTALCAEFLQRSLPAQEFPIALEPGISMGIGSKGSHYLLDTVKNQTDVEKLTGLPVLALLDPQ